MQDHGVGKTTLALQIAEIISRKNKNVVYFSLEMGAEELIKKITAKKTGINAWSFRSGFIEKNDWEKISIAGTELSNQKLKIVDNAYTLQSVVTLAKKFKADNKNQEKNLENNKAENELDLMVIDYIQLLKSNGNYQSREREVSDITRQLKILTLELKIPIIALCQLNRNASSGEPRTSRFKRIRKYRTGRRQCIFPIH